MNLAEAMHRTAMQMGNLHTGIAEIDLAIDPNGDFALNDKHIAINEKDYVGGTLFLMGDKPSSFYVRDNDEHGTFWVSPSDETSERDNVAYVSQYGVTTLSRSILVNAINTALMTMGEHTDYIDLELPFMGSYSSFLLPPDITSPKRIEFLRGERYQRVYGWTFANHKLKLNEPEMRFTHFEKVRIWYNSPHPMLEKDSDEILADYHQQRVIYEAVYAGLFQKLALEQNTNDRDVLLFGAINTERMSLASKYPVPKLSRDSKVERN